MLIVVFTAFIFYVFHTHFVRGATVRLFVRHNENDRITFGSMTNPKRYARTTPFNTTILMGVWMVEPLLG